MTTVDHAAALEIGSELVGPERVITAERLLWYGDGLLTSAAGKRTFVGSNIHTDVEYARGEGLPGAIADGMLSTNYISSMLVRAFGRSYIENGELRTKFIRPTMVDTLVRTYGRVRERTALEDGRVRYVVDVWTEDADGTKLTDGDAVVETGDVVKGVGG